MYKLNLIFFNVILLPAIAYELSADSIQGFIKLDRTLARNGARTTQAQPLSSSSRAHQANDPAYQAENKAKESSLHQTTRVRPASEATPQSIETQVQTSTLDWTYGIDDDPLPRAPDSQSLNVLGYAEIRDASSSELTSASLWPPTSTTDSGSDFASTSATTGAISAPSGPTSAATTPTPARLTSSEQPNSPASAEPADLTSDWHQFSLAPVLSSTVEIHAYERPAAPSTCPSCPMSSPIGLAISLLIAYIAQQQRFVSTQHLFCLQ